MKNSLKSFGLSIVLSIASISAFANPPAKSYIDSENIVVNEGKIYLHTEQGNLEPLTAVYSDEKGLYTLAQDDPNQNEEQKALPAQDTSQKELDQNEGQEALSTQNIPDALEPNVEQETLYAQDTFRELTAGYECWFCGCVNPRYRKTCVECGKAIIN